MQELVWIYNLHVEVILDLDWISYTFDFWVQQILSLLVAREVTVINEDVVTIFSTL